MAEYVDDGVLSLEIDPILKNKTNIADGLTYELWLSTPKLDIKIAMLESVDVMRDYNGNVGDYILVQFRLPNGTYVRDIHPYRDNLELYLNCNIENKETGLIEGGYDGRYKFVIMNQQSTDADPTSIQDREGQNTTGLKIITGQCIDRNLEAIRTSSVCGIYRNTNVTNVIYSAIGGIKEDNLTVDGKPVTTTCTFTKEADNVQNYEHIIVGTTRGKGVNVKVLDLPSYLQNTKYGVYNSNIFTYYQEYKYKGSIFVGPLYDSSLFDKCKLPKLQIIKPNNINYDQVENTFMLDGDIVKILCRSNVRLVDNGENDLISEGSAMTYTNPTAILNRDAIVGDDKVTTDKNTRMSTLNMKDRRDKNVSTNYLGTVVNLYRYRSDYIRSTMAIYQMQWNNCDIDIIYPGMPVCYMYYDNKNGIVKTYGIVQSTYSRYNNQQKSRVGLINIAVEKPLFKNNPEGDEHEQDTMDF